MGRREGGVTNDSSQITDLPAHQKWYNSAYMSFKMFFFVHPPFPVLGHGRKERERETETDRERQRERERERERERREREKRERERDGNNSQITDLPAHQKWYSLTRIRFSKFYVVYIQQVLCSVHSPLPVCRRNTGTWSCHTSCLLAKSPCQ